MNGVTELKTMILSILDYCDAVFHGCGNWERRRSGTPKKTRW